ncbi:MAG: hypothetical protein ABIL09_08875, partial [Gemmatimonadota bacterium]
MPADNQALVRLLADPKLFMNVLRIVDEKGSAHQFNKPFFEQLAMLDALINYPEVYAVKPRQVGFSTVTRAYNFWYGYTSLDPIAELVASHDADSTTKMHRMNGDFLEGLVNFDSRFERPLVASNRKELIFADTKANFRCVTVGGRGAGKSFTFQRGHFTEVGSWEKACDPKATWASLRATMHKGPHYQLVAESTGHGAKTFWKTLVYNAKRRASAGDPAVKVVFSKWSNHPLYVAPTPRDFERTDEEERLAAA